MRTTNFNYNMVNKTIEGSKKAIDYANKRMDPYYSELLFMMNEQPNFNVVEKQRNGKVNAANGKKTYQGLTITKMETLIAIYRGEDELKKFKNVCAVGKALGKKYIEAKRWFLTNHNDLLDRAKLDKLSDDDITQKYNAFVEARAKAKEEAKAKEKTKAKEETKAKKENTQTDEMDTNTNNEKEVA